MENSTVYNPQGTRRRFIGTVVSDAMDKTAVVRVDRTEMISKYHKRIVRGKKYKAHDEENAYHAGDLVEIEETRPISKDKCWRIVRKVVKA